MSNFRINTDIAKLPQIIEVKGILIKQYPYIPPPTDSAKGTLYMNNGVLTYKGLAGTITMIANS